MYLKNSGLLKEAVGVSKLKLLILGIFKIFISSRIEPVILFRFKNAKFIFSSGYELSGYDEIFLKKSYEKISEFSVKHDYVVLDIGANIGIYSIYAALQSPSSKIYAFEPAIRAVERFKKNLKINNIHNVEVINKAIWSKDGKVFIEPNRYTVLTRVSENQIGIPTQAISLDSFVRHYKINKIDILKIDAEFAEDAIVEGAESIALSMTKRIVLEYHSEEKRKKVEEILKDHGFKKVFQDDPILYFIKDN